MEFQPGQELYYTIFQGSKPTRFIVEKADDQWVFGRYVGSQRVVQVHTRDLREHLVR